MSTIKDMITGKSKSLRTNDLLIDRGLLRAYIATEALKAIIGLESDAGLHGEIHDSLLYADALIAALEKKEVPA